MEPKTVSAVLYYYRKKYRLKQEDICGGVCSIPTFSRLEKGERAVDSLTVEILLERIGKEVALFETMLNESDYRLWEIRNEIKNDVYSLKFEQAAYKLKVYRQMMPVEKRIHEQFCLYCEICMDIQDRIQESIIAEKLLRAIRITRPDYGKEESSYLLYSKTEIRLILLFMDYGKKETELLEGELLELLSFAENYYSQRQKEEIGIELIRRLIKCQDESRDNGKIVSYAEKGISMLIQGRGIRYLGELYFTKVRALERQYRDGTSWNEIKRRCYEECKMAYYLFFLERKSKEQEEVQRYCQEVLECPTIEPGILFD
ncbi:MAG: hypothetical protein PUB98_02680 [Clostridiales bacterium]|nr:hypothetical protein [Clostridiales bacterium]